MNLPPCCRVALVLMIAAVLNHAARAQTEEPLTYAIALHGGAGWFPGDTTDVEATAERALRHGRDLLARGGTALDAVEQVIRILEDSPQFNAGKGGVFNAEGRHELDASIMDGRDRNSGAVAGIHVAKNPISVARLVMTESKHVLLTGAGVDDFAKAEGAELVEPDYFWTNKTRRQWEKTQKENDDHHGTVGCVALDSRGNLAAGTSTGGLSMKRFGRVGDSPLIGAGTWADNATCAVSCTGVGELFIRDQIAYDIAARVAYGKSDLPAAIHHHLHDSLPKETGGVIAVSRTGQIVLDFNTPKMPRGAADSSGRFEVQVGK